MARNGVNKVVGECRGSVESSESAAMSSKKFLNDSVSAADVWAHGRNVAQSS